MEPRNEGNASELPVEERRVRLDEKRLILDNSFAKKWLPTLVTLMAGLIAAMFSIVQLNGSTQTTERARNDQAQATERARIDAQTRDEREWGFKVVEMYFSKREIFDFTKNPEQAKVNLSILAGIAPDIVSDVLAVESSNIPRESGVDDSNRLVSLAAVAEVQDALASARPLAPASDSRPAVFTIYVQFPKGGRETAVKTQDLLVKLGYRVPGIEQVANAPSSLEVRYYRPDQRLNAEGLAGQLRNDLGLHGPASAIPLQSSKQLPSGILEVWLPFQPR